MSPKIAAPSAEWTAWAEAHRCPICNALPVRMDSEVTKIERTAKPEYRQAAMLGVPLEEWQSDVVASAMRTEIECENGHTLRGYHWRTHK